MLTYKITQDNNGQEQLETNIIGKALLTIPQLNKGTAFTEEERQSFSLIGKLPSQIENLETQVQRAYAEYKSYENEMNQNVYLNQLLDTNQILFYRLIQDHIEEMLPTIYTPVVGDAVKSFHKRFTNPRGLYITFNDQDRIEEILENQRRFATVGAKYGLTSEEVERLGKGELYLQVEHGVKDDTPYLRRTSNDTSVRQLPKVFRGGK